MHVLLLPNLQVAGLLWISTRISFPLNPSYQILCQFEELDLIRYGTFFSCNITLYQQDRCSQLNLPATRVGHVSVT
jgi:hypothetical protein